MERYDYMKAIKDDIRDYINDNIDGIARMDNDEREEKLYNNMFVTDSITGNASGSYTFSSWKAEEFLCHNLDLLKEALEEFDCKYSILESAESCDVTIRCFLLAQALAEVLTEYDFSEEEEEN